MFLEDSISFFLFFGSLFVFSPLIGAYIARLFREEKPLWLENVCYQMARVNPHQEMTWSEYFKQLIFFNVVGFFFLLLLQLFQTLLPLNSEALPNVPVLLAINTAMSFVTNTNWQSYSGESTLTSLTQMLGCATQNFLSAATGLATLLVLIRGITRTNSETIGNFWKDLVRSTLYLLLPLSIFLALFLIREGVPQTLKPYAHVTTFEQGEQILPRGPVASQVAIKQLGSNGGGFFNANSAHPFENPTWFSNYLETIAILLLPAALICAYGRMVNNKREGYVIFATMTMLWLLGFAIGQFSEYLLNPTIENLPFLEGKETRFGLLHSVLWTISTTATSNGSINAMFSSLSPLTGGIALWNIMLGEVIFGGIGVGLCSMLMMIFLTVFISGLMVGRTPEYLGKKIEKREMQWVMLGILGPSSLILLGSVLSLALPIARSSLSQGGPHGLSEMLYAFSSCAANNGSAFSGISSNTDYFNIVLTIIMFFGRLFVLLPSIALGGLLARKSITPPSLGTLSTQSLLFVLLLIGVILIVGALTFFPAMCLGPIIEHLLMMSGRSFA